MIFIYLFFYYLIYMHLSEMFVIYDFIDLMSGNKKNWKTQGTPVSASSLPPGVEGLQQGSITVKVSFILSYISGLNCTKKSNANRTSWVILTSHMVLSLDQLCCMAWSAALQVHFTPYLFYFSFSFSVFFANLLYLPQLFCYIFS